MDSTPLIAPAPEGVDAALYHLEQHLERQRNLFLRHLIEDVQSRQILQERARLRTFLRSQTCPVAGLSGCPISVAHIRPTSPDVNYRGPNARLVDRAFSRSYGIGIEGHLLKISGKQFSLDTHTSHEWDYAMRAEYRGISASVYFKGEYKEGESQTHETSRYRFRETLRFVLADLQGDEEGSNDPLRLKGVVELFWGDELPWMRMWVGRPGFRRVVSLQDFGLGLELELDQEPEQDLLEQDFEEDSDEDSGFVEESSEDSEMDSEEEA